MDIRPVRPDEHAPWLRLRRRLWPDHTLADLRREQAELVAHPDRYAVFVAAHTGGELIGFVEASVREWAEGCATQPVGYLEGWYVEPGHRRAGIGRLLVEAAEAWVLSRGCTEMGSDAEEWNELGHAAHRALGFSEATRLVCFSKKLLTPDPAREA
ncbi:MAG TPA: aminoglycoside 6'-N-acetyltransferase [Anaerolineales bacterium]|nr:aminoglycoside 6'-N-acetyltransferase [Anaerolineales bacterium]